MGLDKKRARVVTAKAMSGLVVSMMNMIAPLFFSKIIRIE